MDEWQFERAYEMEQAQREESLRRNTAAMAPQTHPDFDGEHCLDCDIEIHPGRLALCKIRCTHCQERKEARR